MLNLLEYSKGREIPVKTANNTIPLTPIVLLSVLVCCCLAVLGVASVSAEESESTQATVDYNLDVRPILADNCFACHGPDAKTREANLRFDTKAGAFSEPSGYPVIVPGKPEESELHLRIASNDDFYRMPPPGFNKTLTPAQIDTITQWIREGAKWEEHWAFTTPVRPTPPDVKNGDWIRNPIDAFILSRLEKDGLSPANEADKRTLIRRLSFDLTGLPPTREEIHQFLAKMIHPTLTKNLLMLSWQNRNTANISHASGWMLRAMEIPTDSIWITTVKCGPTEIG